MPPSKQVRARQNRQKEKIVVARSQQRRLQRRRRVVGTISTVIILGILTALALAVANAQTSKVAVAPPTSGAPVTTTTVPLPSAKDKPCVAVRDKLPKGAPFVAVAVGPPPTKLIIKDLKVGTGAVIAKGASITTNYIGVACSTGKIFDSSYSRGKPSPVSLTGVIKGWTDGIPGMKVGGLRLLGIPSDQAYGPRGNPPVIAPDEALWFVVEPVKIG